MENHVAGSGVTQAEPRSSTSAEKRKYAPRKSGIWADERMARLKELWAAGNSASDVALTLRGEFKHPFTRSAVLGKVHRLKLPDRPKAPPKPRIRLPARRRLPKPPLAELFPFLARRKPELPADQSLHTVTFDQLDATHCRWVLGEPSELLFCGEQQKPGSSFCYRHHAIAYTKPDRGGERKGGFTFRKLAA